MFPKEVNVKEYKFQTQYVVTGHYEFEIEIKFDDDSTKKINTRYSEIRRLYKSLLLKCPGCFIHDIPPKTVWLNIKYGNQGQINDRIEGIKEFFNHIINHPRLKKNKEVINFFKKNNENISNDKNEINNENEDSDDDFQFSDDEEKNENKKENKENKKEKISENLENEEEILPLEEYIEEINKRKMSKGKKIIDQMYNVYVWWRKNSENADDENKGDDEKKGGDMTYIKLNEEDYDFIKKNTSNLGENREINEYKEKISRLNEGAKSLIQNFNDSLSNNEKKINALQNIIYINNDIQKFNSKKNDDDENEKFSENEISINMKKIKEYSRLQKRFLDYDIKNYLNKLTKYQNLLQGLLEIFYRKKDNINFLGRLHSQKTDLEKQIKLKESDDPLTNEKIKNLENKINHQIKFINNLNKDLSYEIENFKKNNEIDIYKDINEIYKNYYELNNNCLEVFNKIKFDEVDDFAFIKVNKAGEAEELIDKKEWENGGKEDNNEDIKDNQKKIISNDGDDF